MNRCIKLVHLLENRPVLTHNVIELNQTIYFCIHFWMKYGGLHTVIFYR